MHHVLMITSAIDVVAEMRQSIAELNVGCEVIPTPDGGVAVLFTGSEARTYIANTDQLKAHPCAGRD